MDEKINYTQGPEGIFKASQLLLLFKNTGAELQLLITNNS